MFMRLSKKLAWASAGKRRARRWSSTACCSESELRETWWPNKKDEEPKIIHFLLYSEISHHEGKHKAQSVADTDSSDKVTDLYI